MTFEKHTSWLSSLAVATGLMLCGAAKVEAGFTEIKPSKKASEAKHENILEHVYGGDFTASGVNFSNGTVNATRIDDFDGSNTDEIWNLDIESSRAVAAFARKKQTFGYLAGTSGDNFKKLFDLVGKDFAVSGSTGQTALDGSVRFSRGENGKKSFSSVASENKDGKDHLVSYSIEGVNTTPTFLLFWEDKSGAKSDFDYNDLVVEVVATGEPLLIPLPAAAWSGMSGLLGLAALAGFKKVRRRLA